VRFLKDFDNRVDLVLLNRAHLPATVKEVDAIVSALGRGQGVHDSELRDGRQRERWERGRDHRSGRVLQESPRPTTCSDLTYVEESVACYHVSELR
jgi:hypothetical protein